MHYYIATSNDRRYASECKVLAATMILVIHIAKIVM